MRFVACCLLTAVVLCSRSALAGVIDQNNNGISDVWEMIFHASNLDPNADDDGDGFTNAQEAAAGTDPRDPNSHPPRITLAVSGGNTTLTWNTVLGKQYQVQSSSTVGTGAIWTNLGVPVAGTGGNVTATYGAGSGGTQFYRVTISDLDSDGDGVTDWEELQLGYDPYRADTFNTGLGDRQAILNALASTDTITVAASRPLATTAYGDGGMLTFTRAGNLDAVTVAYTVAGTASASTDYLPLTGTVTFPVGVNTVNVSVNPRVTAVFNTPRNVTATLKAGTGYFLGTDPTTTTASVTFTPVPAAARQVIAESWDNVTNWGIDSVPWDSPADRRTFLNTLEMPVNSGNHNYGARIRGYLTAPATGTYTFWVACDDIGQFSLSTDDQLANLALLAYTDSYTNSREWNKYPTQKSVGIALTAGKRYAFECRMYQGGGGDNLAVGWLKPGQTGTVPSEVIPPSVLSAYVTPYNPPGLTTLYFGVLSRFAGTPAGATGFASLRLTNDGSAGILTVSSSGTSGVPTSLALRTPGSTGPVIAEFNGTTPQADGTYLWKITDPVAVTALQAGNVYFNLATAAHPAGEIAGRLLRTTATGSFTPPAAPPALPTTAPTAADAGRLLTQATFGVTNADLATVQRDGYAAWVDAQLNTPPTLTLPYLDAYVTSGQSLSANTFQEAWWKNAITAPDQLRQRVAFALSEIMVISDVDGNLSGSPMSLAAYYDVLLCDAFGNFRTLIEDVTLNPAMGDYLNMVGNDKANPDTGSVPNENYGREVEQLFTIGLKKLNPDGTLLLDANSSPIATYGQDEVKGFSSVFTGWNWAQNGGTQWDYLPSNYRQPMELVPDHHEDSAKHLLDGLVLPAGQSGAQDLKDALDVLANHANTGPFLCRQLIQKLVTSNPSPGYVYRVAKVFANNGQGVRGDLRATVRTILLDYEARSATYITNPDYGKEREPIVRLANVYRAFNAHAYNNRYEVSENDLSPNFGQAALDGPSVFNFFSPAYTLTGEIAAAGLVCPEFGITTATTVVLSSNDLRGRVAQSVSTAYPSQIGVDLSALQALAANPASLVDSLNTLLLNGQMSSGLRTQTINAVTSVAATNPLARAQIAVQLLCTSPEFCIQK